VPVDPPPPAGSWYLESTPGGARVYIDGKDVGKTPLKRPADGAMHRVAFVLEGHALYTGEIKGEGRTSETLAAVPEGKEEGRIKVKCKTKGRLVVLVNGKSTGQLCPSERIRLPLGPATVGTYDPVTGETTSKDVVVKLSSGSSQRVILKD
jgi:hypothetical protein